MRHPLPLIAAVVFAFVSEVSDLAVTVEEIGNEIYAGSTTSKLRLKEHKDTLIKVARMLLPWGADVTAKNLAQNGPLLIRFMELKSKSRLESWDSLDVELDMDGLIESLAAGGGDGGLNTSADELCGVKISAESLTISYTNVLERLVEVKRRGEIWIDLRKKSKRGVLDLDELTHSCTRRGGGNQARSSHSSGFWRRMLGTLPPSFVGSTEA